MSKIRYAVMSDIHGNYEAFRTCVDYVLGQGIDKFIFLGDYLGEFPNPQDTMKLIYELRDKYECYFVRGNKEDYWLDYRNNPECEWKNGTKSVGSLKYCYENLTEEDFVFFESLPLSISINKRGFGPILAFHGSPASNRQNMFENDEATNELILLHKDEFLVRGHNHWQRRINAGEHFALDVGSIGLALYAGGNVAQFAILEGDESGYTYNFVSLWYDAEKEIELIRSSGLYERAPYWCESTINLMRKGAPSNADILAEVMKEAGEGYKWYNLPEEYWEKVLKRLRIMHV